MKRLFVYLVVMTWMFAQMDWQPIHYAWWHDGRWPAYAGNWQRWTTVRTMAALILCPPCAALAENYYYVLMEKDAGTEEQAAILKAKYTHNPINPHGNWSFYWGQGEGREWRRVGMLSWWLWWLPYIVIWWQFAKRFFITERLKFKLTRRK